jgi:hypothetical protein
LKFGFTGPNKVLLFLGGMTGAHREDRQISGITFIRYFQSQSQSQNIRKTNNSKVFEKTKKPEQYYYN